MNHRPELDGLRALAVLLVIGAHLDVPYFGGGRVGVDVFFVLSGYLITSILAREFERTTSIGLGHFYIRRVLRLYPALLTMLLVGMIWYRQFGDNDTFAGYLHTAAYSAFYLQDLVVGYTGNPHGSLNFTWSLALEEQFYLLWAPLLLVCLRRGWPVMKVAVSLTLASTAALILEWGTSANNGDLLTSFRPETRANELFLGCCLAVLLPRLQAKLAGTRRVSEALSFLGLAGLVGVELYGDHFKLTLYPLQEVWAGISAALLIVGLTVGANRSLVNRVLSTRPAVSVGRISYGMYLWNIPCILLLGQFLSSVPINWRGFAVMALSLTVLVASLSYVLIERRFLRLKQNFEGVHTSPDVDSRANSTSSTRR